MGIYDLFEMARAGLLLGRKKEKAGLKNRVEIGLDRPSLG